MADPVPMADRASGARVLVVDDEPAVATVFRKLLTHEDFVVEVATDGPSALTAIARQPPDVVLLDVRMPGLDGFEVCRHIKREPATRLTPVVLITALTDRDSRIKGRQAGADDFLTKPVDLQELLARTRSLVRIKRYTDDLDSAAGIILTLAVMIEAHD
jgi:cyclic di-GMP phosphodiesterase